MKIIQVNSNTNIVISNIITEGLCENSNLFIQYNDNSFKINNLCNLDELYYELMIIYKLNHNEIMEVINILKNLDNFLH